VVGDVARSLLTIGNVLFSHIPPLCSPIHERGSDNPFQRYRHLKFPRC